MTAANAAEEMQLFVYFVAVAFALFAWLTSGGPDRGLEGYLCEQRRTDNKRAGVRFQ
jgi:hypothetical protein